MLPTQFGEKKGGPTIGLGAGSLVVLVGDKLNLLETLKSRHIEIVVWVW